MAKRLVIALGGNALGNTPEQQLELVKNTASTIVDLVEEGYDVVVGHGNGPQVGMVNLAFEYSTVDASVNSKIDSVKNPISGKIVAKEIGEIILDDTLIDSRKTQIIEENKKSE